MPRINLTINDDSYQFLKQMKDAGRVASLSHAVRLIIQEYRKQYEKTRAGKRRGPRKDDE
jgi:predicted CopG family antitoxin